MKPHQITAAVPPRKRRRRIARGEGSGKGKTAGRGTLGQGSRSGGMAYPGFEGGQTRLLMRFPSRRGFTNHRFKRDYQPVNVGALNVFPEGTVVGPDELKAKGIIEPGLFKILATGDLEHALTVRAPKFSTAAKAKIESAGGSVEELSA
jgi:large subunit ribosomal protein L15